MPAPVRIIERDPASLSSITAAIHLDRDLVLHGSAEEIRSLQDAEIAIVNLDDLAAYDVTRLQLLGAPPGVELIACSRSSEKLETVRGKAIALLFEPLSADDVTAALGTAKVRVLLQRMESLTTLMEAYKTSDSVAAPIGISSPLPPTGDIEWIEADGNYVNVHTTADCHSLRMTMVQLEAESRGGPLVRGNRKWLVNLDKISNVYFDIAGGIALTLNSGKELTVGRTYRDSMRHCLRNAKLEVALAAD